MNDSWLDKGFSDDLFDEFLDHWDLPLEDVEGNCGSGDSSGERVINGHLEDKSGGIADGEWDCGFQNLETPPANVLAACLQGDFFSDNLLSSDGSSQLTHQSGATKTSSSRSTTLQSEPADVKNLSRFQTSSPVSVLESSSSSTAANSLPISLKLAFPVKRCRSKLSRRASTYTFSLRFNSPFICSTSSTSGGSNCVVGYESESEIYLTAKPAKRRQKKKKNLTLLSSTSEIKESPSQQPVVVRKCMHCEVTKTPQWREGPMGAKTLCNACGVRYRSGRLLPEYRPAASPTFTPSLHSNSHKKVVEMRKKAKLMTVTPIVSSFG